MGTSDNSSRRSGNHSLSGQNGAMRVQSQLLENLSWQALSIQRLSKERHKLEDRPRVGEEHPFPLSANRRPVIIHWKPRGQGGRRKTDYRWPLWTSWSTTSWWRVQSDPITKRGAWKRPPRHWTSPWWTRQETDTRYCGGVVAEQSYRQVYQQEF